MKFRTTLLLLFVVLFSTTVLKTEEKEPIPFNFGLYLGGNVNFHTPDFIFPYTYTFNPGTLDEVTYGFDAHFNESVNSGGFNLGMLFNIPVTNNIHLSGRLGYHSLNGKFEKFETLSNNDITITRPAPEDDIPVMMEHTIDAKLSYFEISPMFKFYNIIGDPYFYLLAGLEFGVAVTNQYDLFIGHVDRDLAIEDISATDVEIEDAEVRAAIALGAGYTFKLSDNVYLSPEATFRFPFTNVSTHNWFDSWNVPQLRLGVNLTFSIPKEKEPVFEETPTHGVNVGFREVRYYDRQGNPNQLRRITLEETQYTELFPIVPYVFFQENSATPEPTTHSGKSATMAGEFKIENLPSDGIEINKSNLDIVSARLKETPRANLTLTGTIDDQEEKGKMDLAQQRADFVKQYIVNNHGIDGNRIQTKTAAKPTKPSSSRVPEGRAENRRVEMSSNVPTVLSPITIQKDRQRIPTPDIIEFVPFAESEDDIAEWELEISQSGRPLKKFTGKGEPRPIQWTIIPNELAPGDIPVDYSFKATTVNRQTDRKNGTVPVDYYSYIRKSAEDRPDRIISKYSLTLFDFDSPEISAADREIITQQVIPNIKVNSTVQIYGYTDTIGDEKYNEKLATQRADNVRNFMQSRAKDAKYETFGVGEKVQIFDNNNAMGRHLSRTVQIYIITPKN